MDIQERIEQILMENFEPVFLNIEDSSDRHARHSQNFGGGHFRVLLVSKYFEDKTPVEQHRLVNTCLAEFFGRGIHALALKTLTPQEWEKNPNVMW
jgi:BolA protein